MMGRCLLFGLCFVFAAASALSDDLTAPRSAVDLTRCVDRLVCSPTLPCDTRFVDGFAKDAYTCVRGDVRIEGTQFSNLDFLSTVTFIGGNLTIVNNGRLSSISSLAALESISGSLVIAGNPGLHDLNGLSNLKCISGELTVSDNDSLESLDGLSSLMFIRRGLNISVNPHLTHIGSLSNLTILQSLTINGNKALTDLSGLANLERVVDEVRIADNAPQTNLNDLSRLRTVGGTIELCDRSTKAAVPELKFEPFNRARKQCTDSPPKKTKAQAILPSVGPDIAYSKKLHNEETGGTLFGFEVTLLPTEHLLEIESVLGFGAFYAHTFSSQTNRLGMFVQLSAGILGGEIGFCTVVGHRESHTGVRLGLFSPISGMLRMTFRHYAIPIIIPYIRWTIFPEQNTKILDGGALIKWVFGNPIFNYYHR